MSERLEKIKKLDEVLSQLKTEFVGLDSIIDEIGKSITPWYITPEVLKRPVVISLWGMSGVGKTSVVRRLLELLDLQKSTIAVDCGSEAGEDSYKSISRKLYDYFMVGEIEDPRSINQLSEKTVFIFDEFQHARFIDESGCEVRNQSLQSIFTIIDSGIVEFNENNDYQTFEIFNFLTSLEEFLKESPSNVNIKLVDGKVVDRDDVKKVLDSIGFVYYRERFLWEPRRFENYKRTKKNEEEIQDNYRSLSLLVEDCTDTVSSRLLKSLLTLEKKINGSATMRTVFDKVNSIKTLGEFYNYINQVRGCLVTPVTINVSKGLVFCIGNLDEAYQVSGDMSSDLDADIFHEETSKVTIGDIKAALRRRFRPEQIARFGNNLIKYPTLGKQHFKDIIKKEVDRICNETEKLFGVEIKTTPSFLQLLYSESVFPTQGVRPILSTINSLFTPFLSDILLYVGDQKNISAEIDVDESDFKVPEVQVYLKYSNGHTDTKTVKLNLGGDRDPVNRKTRFICGIHEAGHAIVMSYLTGKLPLSIVAVSTNHGGFCVTHDKDRINEIDSVLDVKNDVCISAGGWYAEKIIFHDDDKRLLGSSSDISDAWDKLSNSVYRCGLKNFMSYTKDGETLNNGIPLGMKDDDAMIEVRGFFKRCLDKTKQILEENKKLLLVVGKELGQKGEMSQSRFLELIKEYGESLSESRLEEALEYNSYDYYEKCIEEELQGIDIK